MKMRVRRAVRVAEKIAFGIVMVSFVYLAVAKHSVKKSNTDV